ncbi:hypothetical protein BGX31_011390 [Mortierella sp. GBA43]|nr:hypothetical protein BGX31_011390 [Mortierella sp. GBA43]
MPVSVSVTTNRLFLNQNVTKTYQILPRTLARVKVAIHRKSKIQLAVKIVKRNQDVLRSTGGTDVHKEVAILQTIRHPNIVPMVDVIKTKRSVYIFMQL